MISVGEIIVASYHIGINSVDQGQLLFEEP